MKQLLYILLLLSCPAFAQQHKDSIVINSRAYYAGETYIDSVKIDLDKVFFNPKNIKSINKVSGKERQIYSSHDGITFITLKKPSKLLPLEGFMDAVRKSDTIHKNEKILLIIDGALIQNPKGYYIEESYIKKIEILVGSPEQKGDHLYREPTIVITTKGRKKKSSYN